MSQKTDERDLLVESLKPKTELSEMMKMFYEEREKVEQRSKECAQLLAKTNTVLKTALALKDLYLYVSPKTSQLHSECKNVIHECKSLRDSYEEVSLRLRKQEEVRNIHKRMPDIKNQVFAIFTSVCQGYQNRGLKQDEVVPLDEYYGRFFVECRKVKELTGQLELCLTCANTDELSVYLEEIYRYYFDIREQLVGQMFTRNLEKLITKADRNYCELFQQSCALLVRMVRSEKQLFNQIFPSQTTILNDNALTTDDPNAPAKKMQTSLKETVAVKKRSLDEYLNYLCKAFYEHLRPIIIHVNHLETLTELYKLVSGVLCMEITDECFQSTMNLLAEDIQERTIFRTEVFIQESILDYNPSAGDLAYPEKFKLVPDGELKNYQSMWYPTVQRSVLALCYLSRIFDPATFRELAHEIISACYKSLDTAQRLVDDRHNCNKIEASLFLSKHLAIVVDQMQLYGIDQVNLPPPTPLMASNTNAV